MSTKPVVFEDETLVDWGGKRVDVWSRGGGKCRKREIGRCTSGRPSRSHQMTTRDASGLSDVCAARNRLGLLRLLRLLIGRVEGPEVEDDVSFGSAGEGTRNGKLEAGRM